METLTVEVGGYTFVVRKLTHRDQMTLEERWRLARLGNKVMQLSEKLSIAEKKNRPEQVERITRKLDEINDVYFMALNSYNVDRLLLTIVKVTDKDGNAMDINDDLILSLPISDYQELLDTVLSWQSDRPKNIYEDIVERWSTYIDDLPPDGSVKVSTIQDKWSELLTVELRGDLKKKS